MTVVDFVKAWNSVINWANIGLSSVTLLHFAVFTCTHRLVLILISNVCVQSEGTLRKCTGFRLPSLADCCHILDHVGRTTVTIICFYDRELQLFVTVIITSPSNMRLSTFFFSSKDRSITHCHVVRS
jgi:hypothetical protein